MSYPCICTSPGHFYTPNGLDPKWFVVFECRTLRKIKGSGTRIGQLVYGCETPTGQIYLSKSGNPGTEILGKVISADAVEGTDFKRV